MNKRFTLMTFLGLILLSGGCLNPETEVKPKTCTYNGTTYNFGGKFPASDGCNSCSCDKYGVSCTEMWCGDPACTSDKDCAEGSWCGPATDPSDRKCKPLAGVGQSCGGKVLLSHVSRCKPELICDGPSLAVDVPGTCKTKCDDDEACKDGQYCTGKAGACRTYGQEGDPCGGFSKGVCAPNLTCNTDGDALSGICEDVTHCVRLDKTYTVGQSYTDTAKCLYCTCTKTGTFKCLATPCMQP